MPTIRTLPAALLLAGLLAAPAWAATYHINRNTDEALGVGGVVCDPANHILPCTLRAAIMAANANPGPDVIEFRFSGGQQTLVPTSALPAITETLTIDGYSPVSGGLPNTDPTGQNAQLPNRIDGDASSDLQGLYFAAGSDGSVLRGVAVTRFKGAGVTIGGASRISVQGNFIGTDGEDATGALANGGPAVLLDGGATLNTVGGPSIAERNLLVSAAGVPTVRLQGDGTEGNRITDNLIGTHREGTQRVATGRGVEIGFASGNFVHGNVIGALTHGIYLYGSGNGNDNSITANRIGVGTGGQAIGGTGHGILVQDAPGPSTLGPAGTRIGGTNAAAEGNTIAHWGGDGVRVERLRSNGNLARHAILGNSIHGNGALGIELVAVDGGSGPGNAPAQVNGAIPAPAIASAALSGGLLQVAYQLDGAAPGALYRFEAFASAACDASGWGEGQRYLGTSQLAADGAGTASGNATWGGAAAGEFITLTATRDYGGAVGPAETSEFSRCVQVAAGNGGVGGGGTVAVPTMGHAALALLSALVAGAGALRRKRWF